MPTKSAGAWSRLIDLALIRRALLSAKAGGGLSRLRVRPGAMALTLVLWLPNSRARDLVGR